MDKINKFYAVGFFVILALPLLVIPPWFFPPDFGKTIIFRSILALLLLLFTYQFFYKRQSLDLPNIKKNYIIWALVGLFFTYVLSTIFSSDYYFSLWANPIRSGGFVTFAFYIIFAFFCFIIFKKDDWVKVWDFSIFTGILVSLVALIQYYGLFSSIFLPVANRPPSTMGNPILLAIYLLFLLFLSLIFAIGEKRIWKKSYYIIAFTLFLYTILLTGSRAAYLGVLIGVAYFFVWYPTKSIQNQTTLKIIRAVKITIISLLILVIGAVFYVNITQQYPQFLEKNRVFNSIAPRLSISSLLEDSRFLALQVEFNMLKTRPLTGYGMENFSVGFDKHYSPSPDLSGIIAWWDRAHNIIFQTISDAGIFGLMAYLYLFTILFWQLHKLKKEKQSVLLPHGIQTILIGYFIANLFSFDSFGSYLIFFLLIGYSLYLVGAGPLQIPDVERLRNLGKYRKVIVIFLLALVVGFLWQYNLKPLYINAQINKAQYLVSQKNCGQGFTLMEKTLAHHSFLDSYIRLKYVEFSKTCSEFYPQNKMGYLKRGLELIGQAIKIQPNYTRYWIFMGSASNDIAIEEKDAGLKTALISQAHGYLSKALQLAPQHQEIPIQQARVAITAKDYVLAQNYAQNCINLNPNLGECYFYLGLSQIYQKNTDEAKKNIELASKTYSASSKANLEQLANAYGAIEDWQDLILVYSALIELSPDIAQYHSSLAFFYSKTGQYDKAREQALEVLRISPESKANVEAFLRTLP